MTDENNMRTEEGFKDYTAEKLRTLSDAVGELRDALSELIDTAAHTEKRLAKGEARAERMETELQKNTEMNVDLKKDTGEMLEILNVLKGGGTILGWAGKVAKWGGGIAIAWTAVTSAIHGSVKLPWQ